MGQDRGASARSHLDAWRAEVVQAGLAADEFLRRLLQRHLGSKVAECEERLTRLHTQTGARFREQVLEAGRDEHLPSLRRHDADGRPIEEVVFHPAYHDVGRRFWASEVLSVLGAPGSEVLSGALAYTLDQHGEAGHACPVACTAGAIKLIQRLGTNEQKSRYLPGLLESDYDGRLHAAQFVTEVQGGSDVGLGSCRAVPEPGRPGWYRIHGEKWFCSVADAGLFVVSARIEGGESGTKGLGLFLVPRTLNGGPNRFALRRLKQKLGTRSMATGEIDFDGAMAESIGPPEQGFRNLVGIVLDTSRVHNALASCSLMRRAFVEARSFARNRVAFGRPIAEFPAVQEILARMRLRSAAATATTFEILAMTDRLDTGQADEALAHARRIAVMLNKYWTSTAATRATRDGIEILGGNGTIEDFSVMPRLFRDAIVYESWEGTHNTLCAQLLRDFSTRGLHEPWLRHMQSVLGAVKPAVLSGQVTRGRQLHDDVARRIERLLESDPPTAAAHVRHVVDRMCRLADWTALLSQAAWDLEQGAGSPTVDLLDLLMLYLRIDLDPVDAQDDPARIELNRRLA